MKSNLIRVAFAAFALVVAGCDNQGSSSVMDQIQKAEEEDARAAQQNLAEAQRFLTEVSMRQGVRPTPSGLLVQMVSPGANESLPRPPRDAIVLVHYQGSLPNGQVFDSSLQRGQPAEFPLSGVIPGFAEAISLMRPGDTIMAFIPPDLGYGPAGQPPGIPGNSALIFRVQLLAFRTPDGRVVSIPQPQQRSPG